MPAAVKPLFRPDAVRPFLAGFAPPPASVAARPKLVRWAAHLKTPAGLAQKETELLPGFLRDVLASDTRGVGSGPALFVRRPRHLG